MAYNEALASRIQRILAPQAGLTEKKMFGGVGFMIHGNMACGVHKEDLIVRVGAEGYQEALQRPHTRPFDITGRAMRGWVMVASKGCASEGDLEGWVAQGVAFAKSLPGK